MKIVKLNTLKKGDYFRFIGKKKVYIYKSGGLKKGLNYQAENDINANYITKKNKDVETDFEY